MASLSSVLNTPTCICQTFLSSSSTTKCALPSKIHAVTKASLYICPKQHGLFIKDSNHRKRSVVLRSGPDEVSVLDPPPSSQNDEGKSELITSLKLKLLVSLSNY